jgi:hypothetical protein
MRHTLEVLDLLDGPDASGATVADHLRRAGLDDVSVTTVEGEAGVSTDFLRARLPGTGGGAATLGIIGCLGGIGARPERIGLVSDADGAVAALAAAAKLAAMAARGDRVAADVIVTTHICPRAPVRPHDPVPFMSSPVAMPGATRHLVDPAMQAILSIDTSRGNRVLSRRGVAITPTVCQGYILRTSEDLLDLLEWTSGELASVLPITTQDITPYGNGVHHINSILQPAVATAAPVVGVALTAQSVVPGSASGASQPADIDLAARFCVEVAKAYGLGQARFHDPDELRRLIELYGPMTRLQL